MAGIRPGDKRLTKRSGAKSNVLHLFYVRNMFFAQSKDVQQCALIERVACFVRDEPESFVADIPNGRLWRTEHAVPEMSRAGVV